MRQRGGTCYLGVLQASSGRCSHNHPDESGVCVECLGVVCSTCTDIMRPGGLPCRLLAGRSCEGQHACLDRILELLCWPPPCS